MDSKAEKFAFQKEVITNEIDYIHERISHYDELSFKIKSWTITIWAAVVTVGISEDVPLIVLGSIPAVIVFWILDSYFKIYQRRFRIRMTAIENFFQSQGDFKGKGILSVFENFDFGDFPIHDPIARQSRLKFSEIGKKYKDRVNLKHAYFAPSVFLIYFVLVICAGLVFSLSKY